MKKLFCFLAAILALAATVSSLSSCSKEEDAIMHFTLGVTSYSYQGSDDSAVISYVRSVENAYYSALGMSTEINYIDFNSGDFRTRCDEMKSRFDNAYLPAAPSVSGSYSFTITLHGADKEVKDLSDMEVIASKTFSN